jgi:YHS domain-containing protein
MADTKKLGERIDAAFSAMDEKRKKFQSEETQKHQDWQKRLERIGSTFDGLRDIWKPRIELLIEKFGDRVAARPKLTPSTRSVELEFQSDVAKIILRLQATTDDSLCKVILNYDLQIIPILMKFDSHAELEMAIDAVDRDAIARWIDERIVSFVQTYVSLHENPFYLRDQMVQDPVSGTRFPKLLAGATLDRDGKTHYFVSEATRQEFEKRSTAKAK